MIVFQNIDLNLYTKQLQVVRGDGRLPILSLNIGQSVPTGARHDVTCDKVHEKWSVTWREETSVDSLCTFSVSMDPLLSNSTVTVFNIEWSNNSLEELLDSFEIQPYHWYGGSESRNQRWPIEKDHRPMWTYTTADIYQPGHGNVMERYWLCSSKIAITVDDDIPLLVFIDENHLKLMSRYSHTIYANSIDNNSAKILPILIYKLWIALEGCNLHNLHKHVVENNFHASRHFSPNFRAIEKPIWTTWAKFKTNINENCILKFAQEIFDNGFKCSHIEIDDGWASKHGDLIFDNAKFPNPKKLIDTLHDFKIGVSLWVHPFFSLDSDTAQNQVNANFWVKKAKTCEPAVIEWWNGKAYILDVTNSAAKIWFVERLRKFQDYYNIDAFKFDAGEVNWLGYDFCLCNAIWPNQYTTEYANMSSEFGPLVEARCNSRNQNSGNLLRIMDKDSRWGYDNGLKSLIPCALLFTMLNRPYILPDIIGGNAYPADGQPEKELYIRWVQACVFMPAVQFSIAPWDYEDPTCMEAVKKALKLRKLYVDNVMRNFSTELSDIEIVRPLWWTGDESEASLTCDNEFMFGEDILVAPVLEKYANERTVYLPAGYKWKCALHSVTYDGGQIILQKACLDELPFYFKQSV